MNFPFNTCETRYLTSFDIEKQIWRELNIFSDFKSLKAHLRKKAAEKGERLSANFADQKVLDIQYCLRMARDYFESSRGASIATKPTLLYYGITCLSAALLIFKKRDRSLNSMQEGHGLKSFYPPSLKKHDGNNITISKVLEISAEIQLSGTFKDVSNIELSERARVQIKKANHQILSQDFSQVKIFSNDYPHAQSVNLGDLLANIPEIWKESRVILAENSKVFKGDLLVDNGRLTLKFSKEFQNESTLRNHFSFLDNVNAVETNDSLFFEVNPEEFKKDFPLLKSNYLGQQFLTCNKFNNFITTDFVNYYILFFIWGSLSRYKPALWRSILEDKVHGLGIIPEVICDATIVKLPLFLLSEFRDSYYKIY